MIDASVAVDALVSAGPPGDLARAAIRDAGVLQVPSVFAAEVTSAVRSLVLRRSLDDPQAEVALDRLRRMGAWRYPFEPFARRAWALRDNLTIYDAWYVALAESLGTTLVTADSRMVVAPGPRCPVVPVAEYASRG